MILKVGQSLASTTDATALIVVRAPKEDVALTCGGADMVAGKAGVGDGSGIDPAHRSGTLLGKRYVDEEIGLEVLCTKAGEGSLAVGSRPLEVKQAKPLPSSD
ncbi:hypothetical protein C5E45_19420 [Nocardia nova]|uniref:Uncharacterized protein n=1 Tax=Nocardia nova TaxID=37330 RepID=A0A2S6AMX2_9NOCA|nr:hypothetical protein [Nocardia nova]PPJ25785.1 hypothetical protein C5E41_19110 [Nocardia nova]PPJ36585.1 hypothetical protein C5E45_19420 [Nocardia nova]